MKILLVEDSKADRDLFELNLLRGLAKEVTFRAADSLRAGEEILLEFRPDVLVLDLGLPGEDPLGAIPRLRKVCAVVVLTGDTSEETRRQVRLAGADVVLKHEATHDKRHFQQVILDAYETCQCSLFFNDAIKELSELKGEISDAAH